MASVTVTWHTMKDDKVCPVCKAIEGYPWTFQIGEGNFPDELIHPDYGVVWNVALGSMAHGHCGNCRCHVTSEFEFGDLLQKVTEMRDELKTYYATIVERKEGFL